MTAETSTGALFYRLYARCGRITLNTCCVWRKLRLKVPKQQKLNETYHQIPTQTHLQSPKPTNIPKKQAELG